MLKSSDIIFYQDYRGEMQINIDYLSAIFNDMMATFSDEYMYLPDDTIRNTFKRTNINIHENGFISLSEILCYINKKNSRYGEQTTTLYRVFALAKALYGLKLISKDDIPEYVYDHLFVKKRTNFVKLAINRAKIIKELKEQKR